MTDKILIDRAVVESALEALESTTPVGFNIDSDKRFYSAISALRTALAQEEQPYSCRWVNDTPTQECTFHRIAKEAARYWAERAKMAEAKVVALGQQEQEPYCYVYEYDSAFGLHREFYPGPYNGKQKPDRTVPVYTHPPATPEHEPLPQDDINWLKARPHIERFIKEQDHDVTITDRSVTFTSRGMWVDREFFARSAIGIKEEGEVHWAVEWGQKNDRPFCMISKRLDNGLSQIMATHYGPPRREWQGLTDVERDRIVAQMPPGSGLAYGVARAIEAALKEKNT